MTVDAQITPAESHYRAQIEELQAQLDRLRPKLITAETELAERLADISAFEFRLRARLGTLHRRLESIEAEIVAYRKQLQKLQDDWFFAEPDDLDEDLEPDVRFDFAEEAGAAASGEYRYRDTAVNQPRQDLSASQSAELKRLYRQLARRFHPDFGLDEADRAQRTQIMMAINAAYALGDLDRLHEIAEQPDLLPGTSLSDAELVQALMRELEHCRRRLGEIRRELERLETHPSTVLMRRAEKAAANGRDYFDDLEADMRMQIQHKMVQRDVLRGEIDSFSEGLSEFNSADFADTVYDLGLELLEDDGEAAIGELRERYRERFDFGESPDEDDEWRAIRKATRKKKG